MAGSDVKGISKMWQLVISGKRSSKNTGDHLCKVTLGIEGEAKINTQGHLKKSLIVGSGVNGMAEMQGS